MEKHRVERDSGNFSVLNINLNFSLFNRSADADNPVNLLGLNNPIIPITPFIFDIRNGLVFRLD
jgi:hypothetical protein